MKAMRRLRTHRVALAALVVCTASLAMGPARGAMKVELLRPGGDPLVLVVSPDAPSCVRIAVEDVARDVFEATRREAEIRDSIPAGRAAIVIGVTGRRGELDRFEARGTADFSAIRGKWESFLVHPVADHLLLVAGSDARGAMYGLYEVSERLLGTDPLKHWTGHVPERLVHLSWSDGVVQEGPPTFRYRGLFINDENLLMGWHGKEATPNLGPEAYAQILETICRLKGNLIAPAMYANRIDPESRRLTEERGLHYTSSHLELLLANPTVYWRSFAEKHWGEALDYSYSDHPEKLRAFWQESIQRHREYRNIWPIGLRGVADFAFWVSDPSAPKTPEGRARVVQRAINTQSALLDETLGASGSRLTSLTLYEELQGLFETGLIDLREDTILVWCDDGFNATMRALPTGELQNRPGGNGVYFHLANCDKQWTQWVSLEHLQKEFKAVLESGANEYVLFNVGDLREVVLSADAAMDLAWDATPWLASETRPREYLEDWASGHFGGKAGRAVADLYRRYYDLESPNACTYVVEWLAPSTTSRHLYGLWQATSAKRMTEEAECPELLRVYALLKDFPRVRQRREEITESHLMETAGRWDGLHDEAVRTLAQIPTDRRALFFDHLVLQIQTSRLINHWGLHVLRAFRECGTGDFAEASLAFREAVGCMDTLVAEREKACHGKWRNWFRGEYHNGWQHNLWSLRPRWHAEDAHELAELALQAAEGAGAEGMVFHVPKTGDVEVPLTVVLPPDYDPAKVKEVRIYGWSCGRKVVPETTLWLNGEEITLRAMDGSKNPFYRVELEPSILNPGRNTLAYRSGGNDGAKAVEPSPFRLALCLFRR